MSHRHFKLYTSLASDATIACNMSHSTDQLAFNHTDARHEEENFWKHGTRRQIRSTGASNWTQFTHPYVQKTNNSTGKLKEDRILDSQTTKQGTPWRQINNGHNPGLEGTKVNLASTRLRRRGCQAQRSRWHRRMGIQDNGATNGITRPNN
ncbi:hypothetical protein T265_10777 [Opisthorchis viverrini]|uniref:Uncharacterized protein n=1 Tax=Opisthorchis viverrini TaxID=6198 RepID=A0A074Z5F5_OPIVI|nr:hypothetical protein T265_10777 [Opisthorchis viverrini]KER20757.1 hypothetical protein T265_10777 [Opisthorchis viverrini]